MGHEIIGEQLDRRYFRIDPQFDQVLVDQRLYLGPGIGDIQAVVLVALLDHAQQVPEATRRTPVRMAGRVGQNQIEALKEFFQIDLEVCPPLDILHCSNRPMDHPHLVLGRSHPAGDEEGNVLHAGTLEMLQQPLIALFQNGHLAEDVFQAVTDIPNVFLGINLQSKGQVIGQADVVDDESTVLVGAHPVDPGNGLQQVVLFQFFVDVHHLFNGGVETGEQHVADNQKGNAGQILVRIVKGKGLAEVVHRIPAAGLPASLGEGSRLVGRLRGNNHHGLEKLDLADQLLVRFGADPLPLDPFPQGRTDGRAVADGRQLRVADHLCLEPIRQDVVDVVIDQIPGNGRNPLLRLQDVAGCAVFLLDRQDLFFAAFLEQVLELGVKAVFVADSGVGGAALVENLQGGTVMDGIHQLVHINVLAKPFHRAPGSVLFGDQRRTGEGDAGGVGESLEQVVAQVGALGPVGLVDHQKDPLRRVDHAEGAAGGNGAVQPARLCHRERSGGCQDALHRRRQRRGPLHELMHHHHVDVRGLGGQVGAQISGGVDDVDLAADQLGGRGQLFFQVVPVIDQDDFEILQIGGGAQHAGDKDHGQRLARTLGVPDHPGTGLRGGAGAQPFDDFARRPVLLVAADHFYASAAVGVHEHGAGAQHLQQSGRGQQSLDEPFLFPLHPQRQLVVAVAFRPDVLPGVKMFMARGDGAKLAALAAGAHQE